MSSGAIKPNSKITLHNKTTGTTSNISVERVIPGRDVTLHISPTDNFYLSTKRLENIKTNLREYVASPTLERAVHTPRIISYEQKEDIINFKITPYTSDIMLPYVGLEYVLFSRSPEGTETILKQELHHNLDYTQGLKISIDGLTSKTEYRIKMRYYAGGYVSKYSDDIGFTPIFPTINTPVIRSVGYQYGDQVPYRTTISVETEPFTPIDPSERLTHISTTWRAYKKVTETTYDLVYTSEEDTRNLTSISIMDLVPGKISHHEEFFFTATFHGYGSTFSKESEYFRTSSTGITVSPSKNLNIYPIELNHIEPIFIVDNTYTIKIGDQVIPQTLTDLESIQWELEYNDVKSIVHTYSTTVNKLEIKNGEILPNRNYTIRCRYKHKLLGYSSFISKSFTTAKIFSSTVDKLSIPRKTYNNLAYFGEIPYEQLMVENVRYRGKLDVDEHYQRGDEVSKEGILYICLRSGPGTNFDKIFKPADSVQARELYGSGLPTMNWLLNNIGLNPYLNNNGKDFNSSLTDPHVGWIKVQNERGQILYVAKKSVLRDISINDLIDKDLYHPRRKTVRIGNNLYYIRMLAHDVRVGYDALDPLYTGNNFNESYEKAEPIVYDENTLMENLMNSKLATYDPNDLGIPIVNEELLYHTDNIYAYKVDQMGGTVAMVKNTIPWAEQRAYRWRPVLELIPHDKHPFKHISSSLPKAMDVVEGGVFDPKNYFDPYVDCGYLGYVSVDDFINAETLDIQSGLLSSKDSPILGWFKIYYRGLIYFVPDGTILKGVTYRDLDRMNMISPTPRFAYNVTSDRIKFGKIFLRDQIYNISLPNGLKFTSIRDDVIIAPNTRINLFENKNPNVEPDFCYDTFLSDVIYGLIPNVRVERLVKGYKGRYKNLKYIEAMNQMGSGNTETHTFLLSDVVRYTGEDGREVLNPIANFQKVITKIEKKTVTDPMDVVVCLTINPIYDQVDLW